MKIIKRFKLSDIPMHKILFVATSEPGYEMERTILAEDVPGSGDYYVVQGSHCSCFGFDDTQWDAVQYTTDELKKLAQGWLEHGTGSEAMIAPLILRHIQ